GRIWVESREGLGSTFHFTARFDVQPASADQVAELAPVRLQDLSVLIVDDNASNRQLLQDLLTRWGMKPTAVNSGPAGLAGLEHAVGLRQPFALVLLDAMMPDMDGFTVAEHMKQSSELAKATLMMLSSADLPQSADRCRVLGLDGYLTKPITQASLLETIVKVL